MNQPEIKKNPYVYKITHKTTNQFYIGFRSANKIRANLDLGFKYFTSSKAVKELGFSNFKIDWIEDFKMPDGWKFGLTFKKDKK